MELSYYGLVVLMFISTLLQLIMAIFIMKMKNKQQIHYAFLGTMVSVFFWSIIRLIQIFVEENITVVIFLEKLHYIGVILLPVALLLTGIIYAKTHISFSWKYGLLFAFPLLSIFVVFTNDYHQLFIVRYSFISTEFVYGPYYLFHEIYSYSAILIGMFYLLYFTIKNSGFFSRQSFLVLLGMIFPLVINLLSTRKIVMMPVFFECISFSFAIFCFAIAIFKFEFLNIVPVALQRIVDLISDSYIVVNEAGEIIDYNKPFVNKFQAVMRIQRKDNIMDILSNLEFQTDKKIIGLIKEALEKKNSTSFEEHIIGKDFDKHFIIEITPILSNQSLLGTIILFKDVSEHKRNIEIIKRNQEILMEQERMVSLGQMIGGIAHNLNTPIMSLAGGIEALKDLAHEYKDSIEDENVTAQDHNEIASEMLEWLEKMKPYCSYMTDIISAVKGQAVQMNYSTYDKFTIEELVKRIDVLMKHELKKYHCLLKTDFDIDMNTEIKGELNGLVQVFDNIILNALHAYEGESGEIYFRINRVGNNVEFTLRDNGKGMPEEVQKKLFKEMLTTKGKHGTGLGLYMSYSTIRGRFLGNIRFESTEGIGTTFYITIPCINSEMQQEESK